MISTSVAFGVDEVRRSLAACRSTTAAALNVSMRRISLAPQAARIGRRSHRGDCYQQEALSDAGGSRVCFDDVVEILVEIFSFSFFFLRRHFFFPYHEYGDVSALASVSRRRPKTKSTE